MELDVKAVTPSASGWKTIDGKTHVTNWNAAVLLRQDIWSIDREPSYFRADLGEGNLLYLSQDIDSGYSSFYLQTDNHRGFGGREIELEMFDGSTVALKGPWSSNSGVVNGAIQEQAFGDDPQFDYVKEVTFYSHDWRSTGWAAGSLSANRLRMLVQEFLGAQWHLAWDTLGDSNMYIELHAPEVYGDCKDRKLQ